MCKRSGLHVKRALARRSSCRSPRWREQLRAIEVFHSCSNRQLDGARGRMTEVSIRPGDVLMREGGRGSEVLFISSGTARLERDGHGHASVGRGDVVGELALLTGDRRSATIVAETPMKALVCSANEFASLRDEIPEFDRAILSVAVSRLAGDLA